jgi:hypothetical protein
MERLKTATGASKRGGKMTKLVSDVRAEEHRDIRRAQDGDRYGISIDVANCIITGGNVDDIVRDAVRVGRRRDLCAVAEYWPKALALATNMRKIAHMNELRTPLRNSRYQTVSVLAPLPSPGHVKP